LAQQAGQFTTTAEQEAARLLQARNEAALDRWVRIGEFGATIEEQRAGRGQAAELERERLAQQAGQFTTTAEQEAARLLQARNEAALDRGVRIGEIGATTGLQQQALDLQKEQADAETNRLLLSTLLATADDHEAQRAMLGYNDTVFANQEMMALMRALGLRQPEGKPVA